MSVAGKRLINKRNIMILIGCLLATEALAQKKTPVLSQPDDDHVMVTAGNYKDNFFRNLFWGKHYRQEWNTAIVAPIMELDTVAGGLRPIKAGGGRQTKSLRLADARGREYVLRSVDKSFGRMLPKIYRNTFWEDLLNDQGTFDHPYAAFTIAPMADAAGVYHTTPRLEYVPQQDALDDYNEAYGDRLYLFEERADDNWEENGGFGHTGKIISTEKVLSKLLKNNKASVDQVQYVRSRLFDMFIGDWGRHEDQWRWGEFDKNGKKIYKPIPRDRDHAYARFGGIFPDVVISMIGVPRIQALCQ